MTGKITANLMYKSDSTGELSRCPIFLKDSTDAENIMKELVQAVSKNQNNMYVCINDKLVKLNIIDYSEDGTRFDLIRLVGVWIH